MSELWEHGALELAGMIRDRQVSSVEVVSAHLERIESVNPHVNAIVRVLGDEALIAAAAADRAVAAGDELGVFHGVPCTVKENIDLTGTPTTQGVAALADAVADRDAPVVERMRAAGAIPIGRTNLPDLGLRIHTVSQLHGRTFNPWNPHVTAGGSSGGEAAALATGMSPLGLGNDIGGSLRNPAHCCGIASIKPSVGLVPSATVVPPLDPMLAGQLMAVDGPMARHVADVRTALGVLAGADRRDPVSVPVTLVDPDPTIRRRIALVADPPGGSTDAGIAAAVRRAGDALADLGHDVVEVVPPMYEEILMLWAGLLAADIRPQMALLEAVMGEGGRTVMAGFDRQSPPTGPDDIHALHVARHEAMRIWSAFFEDHPILITPTWARRAFDHDADLVDIDTGLMLETFRPVLAPNALGLPAAVVPVGVDDGLPVGIQVIGDRYTDLHCLRVAEELEGVFGRLCPIDPVR